VISWHPNASLNSKSRETLFCTGCGILCILELGVTLYRLRKGGGVRIKEQKKKKVSTLVSLLSLLLLFFLFFVFSASSFDVIYLSFNTHNKLPKI